MADMLVDCNCYEEYNRGDEKQYYIFDSNLLRFKPDYSKLSISDFDDYANTVWIIRGAGGRHGGVTDKNCNLCFDRIGKKFRFCAFTTNPFIYDKAHDFYEDSKNVKYFENIFSLLSIRYKLIDHDCVKKLRNEYENDIGDEHGQYWWRQTEKALFAEIEYVETMGNLNTKMYFGTHKTRRHYYGILTSLTPWSVFLNSGICG